MNGKWENSSHSGRFAAIGVLTVLLMLSAAFLAAVLFPPIGTRLLRGMSAADYRRLSGALLLVFLALTLVLIPLLIHRVIRPLWEIGRFVSGPLPERGEAPRSDYAFVARLYRQFTDRANAAMDERSRHQLDEIADAKVLQSQISPHFLDNTLDAIRGELVRQEQYGIADMVEQLSGLFRFSIGQGASLVSFEEELENTEKYIRIMQFRFGNRFAVTKILDSGDNAVMGHPIPKLTLQPIVENAIKHGLESKLGTGHIIIRALRSDRNLLISVEDDGVGMDAAALGKLCGTLNGDAVRDSVSGSGMGLALPNINKRIQLLFGSGYGLSVASSPGSGTQVQITLPLVCAPDGSLRRTDA